MTYFALMDTGTLFGSRVRAETLETLAATSKPLSAYRLAKIVGAEPIQVLSILKSLDPDLVRHTSDGWVLTDDALRGFLRQALARRESERRSEKDELLIQLGFKPRAPHGRH